MLCIAVTHKKIRNMKNWKLWMLVPVLLAALASCKKTPQKEVIEVKATPATLLFGAVGNEAQTVAVTANDEWEYSASETWVTASKVDGETLSVTVDDNVATAAREAKVTLYAKSDANARAEVLIQQSGAGELTFNVTPASMTFVGEGAEPQVITVEASEGLVWEAAPAADVTWIQVAAEGNQISVTVDDNPNTTERSGRVIVSSPIGEKAVLVTQQGKVVPMIYDVDPASLEFRWDDMMMMGISFKTSAEVTDWSAHVEDANGNQTVDWLFINANKDAALPLVEVMPILFNETSEDRTAYIVLTPQGVEDPVAVRVPVVQKGKPTYNSTLTDNVEVALSHAYVTLYPNGTTDLFNFSRWNLTLWGEGVNYDSEFGMWSGTGHAMQLQLQADKIAYEASATSYQLPAGTYTVGTVTSLEDQNGAPGTCVPGAASYNYDFPMGSWLVQRNDGAAVAAGPIASGTITVAYDGSSYTITLDCMDDNNHTITGTYTGNFGTLNIVPPAEDPNLNEGDGGGDPMPEM